MNKWEYGGLYKKYDMSGIIEVGTGKLKVHNIFDPLPDFMKEADCIFCDPPCSKANINSFYTKADRTDYQTDYLPFAERFFECVDEINPTRLFVEVFKSNFEYFIQEIARRFPFVKVYESKYYNNNKNKCWIIQGTQENEIYNFNGLDESKIIAEICNEVPFECIGDLCMGQGLVGSNAYRVRKKFVGTEINKKRLAVLVDSITISEKIPNLIEKIIQTE